MILINLFAGPGVGKSTAASGIFHKMKTKGYSVEIVHEYAKELVYGKDFLKLSDQLLILAEQNHRLYRLRNQVDYVINDAPFLIGLAHMEKDPYIPKKEYKELTLKMFEKYDSINIFLERNPKLEYQTYGRDETMEDAIRKDEEIKKILIDNNIHFNTILSGGDMIEDILEIIEDEIKDQLETD